MRLQTGICLTIFTISLSFYSNNAYAVGPSTSSKGFSGKIVFGGQTVTLKSNMIYGLSDYNNYYDKTDNNSSESAETETIINPIFSPGIAYTFENNTKIFFLTKSLEPYSTNDSGVFLGISCEKINGIGNIGISGIYGVPVMTWKDPYAVSRETTESGCFGVSAEWEKLFGSNFNLNYMFRKLTIENEKSGETEGLLSDEMDLLKRDGYHHRAGAEYIVFIGGYTNILKFGFDYDIYDLEGDAMSFKRYTGKMAYTYINTEYQFNINLSALYAYSQNEEINPLFEKTIKTKKGGGSITVMKEHFISDLDLIVNIQSYLNVTNQDFYDSYSLSIGAGLIYHI